MKTPRQTVSFLTRRFREVGLQPDARHGQNFLIDLNLLELLARSADPQPEDVILEVGTGTGSLTAMMAEQAAAVVTVEIDAHLHQMARELLAPFDNVTMLLQDALRNKNNFHNTVIETIQSQLAAHPNSRFKLAANLPYNVATPIVSNLLLWDTPPQTMTITIQKELADRIVAGPNSKDYGSLSLWVQSQCHAEVVRIMPPDVFWPRPKVHSAIVQIELDQAKRQRIPDIKFFHAFCRNVFFHRRKFLRSVLLGSYKHQLNKPQVDDIMADRELGPKTRAEQLDLEAMFLLGERIRQEIQSTPDA